MGLRLAISTEPSMSAGIFSFSESERYQSCPIPTLLRSQPVSTLEMTFHCGLMVARKLSGRGSGLELKWTHI